MSKEEEFIELYEYIQGRLISSPGFECSKRRDNLKKTRSFLEKHHSLTSDLYGFISFIFFLRTSAKNRYIVIPFVQFISENAYKRYQSRSQQDDYFTSRFLYEREIGNPTAEKEEKLPIEYLDSKRAKYFNTPRGYIECESFNGVLFDEMKCKECKYNYLCKK